MYEILLFRIYCSLKNLSYMKMEPLGVQTVKILTGFLRKKSNCLANKKLYANPSDIKVSDHGLSDITFCQKG